MPNALTLAERDKSRLVGLLLCVIAQQISYAATAIAVDEMEPHVPWDEPFLTMRRAAYEAIGNPLAAKARRDLADFRRLAGESHVLRGP